MNKINKHFLDIVISKNDPKSEMIPFNRFDDDSSFIQNVKY